MIKYDDKTKELTISYPTISNADDMFKALASHLMSCTTVGWIQGLGSDIWQRLAAGESDDKQS